MVIKHAAGISVCGNVRLPKDREARTRAVAQMARAVLAGRKAQTHNPPARLDPVTRNLWDWGFAHR